MLCQQDEIYAAQEAVPLGRRFTSIDEAQRFGGDFCLATHYWEVDAALKRVLDAFLEFAARQPRVRFVAVEELFA